MTSYLVATASVHVTAAAADYLEDRIDPSEDHVVVVAVRESLDDDRSGAGEPARDAGGPQRDAGDAANVARSRLAAAMPEIDLRDGAPTAEIRAAIDEHEPDVVVIGPHGGTKDAGGLGSTARDVLAGANVSVVVVPVPTGDRRAQS